MIRTLTLLVVSGTLVACSGEVKEWPVDEYKAVKITTQDQSLMVAQSMADLIEKRVKEDPLKNKESDETDLVFLKGKEQRFLPFRVYLKEVNKGALKHGNVYFDVRSDNAVLDLEEYVSADIRGGFYFYPWVDLAPEEGQGPLRVFYASHAKKREIDDRTFGVGCHRYAEVTKHFHKMTKEGGLELNTTKQRYLSVLAGTYVFLYAAPTHYYLSTLHITDSRFPELLCP